jgi:lipoprotein-anchoring transpeptidase ErfK/SrfK
MRAVGFLKPLRLLLLGLVVLELLALAGLGLPWLRGLGSDDGAASASPTGGLRVSQLPPWALLPTTVPESDLYPFQRALAEANSPEPEPDAAPPPGPSIEEIGAQELATTVPPPGITFAEGERWILVNTATQRAVAFEGAKPVRVALVTTGMPSWVTPWGEYHVYARVENETMDSTSLGYPADGPDGWHVEDVLWVQHFNGPITIHYNYWRAESYFGNVASSHGCVGMRYNDAKFFWDFATIGTRVVVVPFGG